MAVHAAGDPGFIAWANGIDVAFDSAIATTASSVASAASAASAAATSAAAAAASTAVITAPTDAVVASLVTTSSGTKAALDAAYDPAIAMLGGVAGYAYGNSWVDSSKYALKYPMRLPEKLGMASMTEFASSGFAMQDTAVHAIGTIEPFRWPAGRKGVVVVGDLLNNLMLIDNAANMTAALEGMRALVATLSAGSRTEETAAAFTYSGTWPTLTVNQVSGGTAKYIQYTLDNTTEGAGYVDVALPSGVNYLVFTGTGTSSGSNGGTMIIREGATELGRVATDDTSVPTPFGTALGAKIPIVFRVPGTTAKTVRVTMTGNTATAIALYGFVDAFFTMSAAPPLVVLVKPVTVLASSHANPTLLTYLRTIPDTVKAEFGSHVLVADPAVGWDPAAMLGEDGLHPNEAGSEHIATVIANTVRVELMRRMGLSIFPGMV